MKKFLVCLVIILSMVCLVACGDDKDETAPVDTTPSFEILSEGEMNQSEDNLSSVTFTAEVKNFDGEISWYVNNVDRQEHGTTFTFRPTIEGLYRVYYKVRSSEGEEERSVTKELRVISGARANIKLTTSDESALEQYYGEYKTVSFDATISGNYQNALEEMYWYVDGIKDESSKGKSSYSYTPSGISDVEVHAQVGDKFKSNFFRIRTIMGRISVAESGSLEQVVGNTEEVSFEASTLGQSASVNVDWYVNGEKQATTGSSFSYKPVNEGAYKIEAKAEEIVSEPRYIIVGREVSTESELLAALSSGAKGIILTDDIDQTKRIDITKTVAIGGMGHKIVNVIGTAISVNVSANNVVFYDIGFFDAGKYNLQFYGSENSYVEKAVFESAGYSGIHIHHSVVTVKDVDIKASNFAGIEMSHPRFNSEENGEGWYHKPVELYVLGSFKYDTALPVPIYTMDNSNACKLISEDFNEFAVSGMVSGEERVIRRWCNDGCNIGWVITPPVKTEYESGEILVFDGVGLRVSVCNEDLTFDYTYVNMAIDNDFDVYVELVDISNNVLDKWYVVGFDGEQQIPIFENESGEAINGALTNTATVRINVYIAGMYVGYFNVSVR